MENPSSSPRTRRAGRPAGVTWFLLVAAMVASLLPGAPAAATPTDQSVTPITLLQDTWDDASVVLAAETDILLVPEPVFLEPEPVLIATDAQPLTVAAVDDTAPAELIPYLESPLVPVEYQELIFEQLNGWMPNVRHAINKEADTQPATGAGVDIALIDSGITPVQGLHGANKIVNGPDLSSDGAIEEIAHLDRFGHGTHLAGIIAGNDAGSSDSVNFMGIAPDARLVNVKVADGEGNTSLEQLVAGIDWVIANKNTGDLNIRVIVLAVGHITEDVDTDPFAAAVEAAWDAGIVVVAAAGNRGNGFGLLDSPALDHLVIAVAGSNQNDPFNGADDTIATWSSSGNADRQPDIAAPGKTIVSLRVPGSYSDTMHPESALSGRFAVASGTSQSAAVAAGAVALVIETFPNITPDEVKALLEEGAGDIVRGTTLDGSGIIRLNKSLTTKVYSKVDGTVQSDHRTTLQLERSGWEGGGFEETLQQWAGATWSGATWSGGTWSGATWSGATWSGATWSGATWSGATWSGATWSGATWSGATWSGATWSGATWSGSGWE